MPIPVSTMEDLLVNSKMAISNAMSNEETKDQGDRIKGIGNFLRNEGKDKKKGAR